MVAANNLIIIFLLINLKNGVYLQEFSLNNMGVNQPLQYGPADYANLSPLPYLYHYQPQYRLPNYQPYGAPLHSSHQRYPFSSVYPLYSPQNYPQSQDSAQIAFNPYYTQRDPYYYVPTEIIDVAENGKFDFYDELHGFPTKPVYEQSRQIDIEENLIKPQIKEDRTLSLLIETSLEPENLLQNTESKIAANEATESSNLNKNVTVEETTLLQNMVQEESIEIQSDLPTPEVSSQTEKSTTSVFDGWFKFN